MDPFAAIIFGGIAVIVVSVWLVGRFYPGSGLEEVGLRSAREIHETREALAFVLNKMDDQLRQLRNRRETVEHELDEVDGDIAELEKRCTAIRQDLGA